MGTTIRPDDMVASTASKLQTLEVNLERFRSNEAEYFDKAKDKADVEQYYAQLNRNEQDGKALFNALTDLLTKTHDVKVPYSQSDEYLKTLVDLHDDGYLRSIYSGKEAEPHKVIEEDASMVAVADETSPTGHILNVEHVVPQSWFDEAKPMRGDLHHLFYCEKGCNFFRGNKRYVDFADYNPEEFRTDTERSECGKGIGGDGATDGQFEPEYGKGIVARAMLYFILRYPKAIEAKHIKKLDVNVLLKWHKDFPPNLKYEKHRNQEIYKIQGNRNPFIDLPELADRIDFSMFKPSQ
ncbi:endonuclease I [Paenibacillus sp. FSL R7-0273]|uniref:endonuclease I family protein n=1 Tax=Paenibacillus sp. FSL R7-0273 TaxID=1536772 RepID=UPI0004F864DB|nr:endonuclease [Paenibacillus sp. FSL R7-0273]AIQ48530.1 endonuclease I [Paenibacillus sp. FSL R7-0273]OMF87615.1 endonuclease I [Paenibacillus sp. FSL R7-0273]